MLHRLSLRILPQLHALVTEPPVRKKKRLVMLAPGLVAFGIYHLSKPILPLSDPFTLLTFSGCIAMLSAIWAYRQGRGISIRDSFRQDGIRRWVWLVGWIGLVYGIQLSLLVLAILQVFVGYDFLRHPEGPAMMAIIISSTSVTRDAFEIGHVQGLLRKGVIIPTFPDGVAFRNWVPQRFSAIWKWGASATILSTVGSWIVYQIAPYELQPLLQSVLIPPLIASLALLAFFAGETLYLQNLPDKKKSPSRTWMSILWFWIWPNLTFSATYFLVMIGLTAFVFRMGPLQLKGFVAITACTALLMAIYPLYLGWRKSYEEQVVAIPDSLQRCPFVMGILQNTKSLKTSSPPAEANLRQGDLVN